MNLTDMKAGPVKRIVERQLRDFANDLEDAMHGHIGDRLVKAFITELMIGRGILPGKLEDCLPHPEAEGEK